MIPYPGESLPIFQGWAAAGDDYTLGGDVVYRAGETADNAGSRELAAGAEWRAWVGMGGTDYLDDPADCDTGPVWVVVVDSGTATVAASEGQDDGFGDTTAAHGTALGTFTLTPGDNVIPSAFTVSDVWGGWSSMMLVLEATGGSAVVSQVKLRLWPSTGAAGGWGDVNPGFDSNPVAPTIRYAADQFQGDGTNPDPETSWDAAQADYATAVAAGSTATGRAFDPSPPFGPGVSRSMSYDLTNYATTVLSRAVQALIYGVDPAGFVPIDAAFVEGVDWIRPPDEVRGDVTRYAQQTGTVSTGWTGAHVTITTTGDPVPGSATVASQAGAWDDEDPGALWVYSFPYAHAPEVTDGPVALATDGRMILVQMSHSYAAGGDPWPGWAPNAITPISDQESVDFDFSDVRSFASFPPYRYWSPTAVHRRPLRQWPLEQGDGGSPRRYSRDALSSYGSGAPRRYGAGYQ